MDSIPIGEAASRLQMTTSALRYYDERGLVCPRSRRSGRRMYGPEELRRLAFLKIVHRLGLPLGTAAAVLDAPGEQWRDTVRGQIADLDRVIAQARAAQQFLTDALNCPTDHPARQCPSMIGALDRRRGECGTARRRADRGERARRLTVDGRGRVPVLSAPGCGRVR